MTYEEWLNWAGESAQSERVDGEVIVFMPPNVAHARVSRLLRFLLGLFVEPRDLDEGLAPSLELGLIPGWLSREPDLIFVAKEHGHRVTEQRIEGAAELVVKIVSPDSIRRDYEAAGIPEYWLFDPRPRRRRAEFRQLGRDGQYRLVPPDPDGRSHSAVVPGFWLRPEWRWQDPLPPVRVCLAEIEATSPANGDPTFS